MIFWYSPFAGEKKIIVEEEAFHYLIRVRRQKKNDEIAVQDGKNPKRYYYHFNVIEKKTALLEKVKEEDIEKTENNIHICWGICDAKTIYDTIPSLIQIGVSKITFLKTDHCQHSVRLSFEKIQTICINAMQQCGQWKIPEIEELSLLESLQKYNNKIILDMTGETVFSGKDSASKSIYIGPEGGWSESEKMNFMKEEIKKLDTNLVLKSETAIMVAAASRIIG